MKKDQHGVKRDMLLIYDFKSLVGRAGSLKEALFEVQVVIKRLLKNFKTEFTPLSTLQD